MSGRDLITKVTETRNRPDFETFHSGTRKTAKEMKLLDRATCRLEGSTLRGEKTVINYAEPEPADATPEPDSAPWYRRMFSSFGRMKKG